LQKEEFTDFLNQIAEQRELPDVVFLQDIELQSIIHATIMVSFDQNEMFAKAKDPEEWIEVIRSGMDFHELNYPQGVDKDQIEETIARALNQLSVIKRFSSQAQNV
jgi:hypothetical protein